MNDAVICQCCGGPTTLFGSAWVLGKHQVEYCRCSVCGFIQTESPFWLAESYANPMTSYDLGGVSRPTLNSAVVKSLLATCFDGGGKMLDFGGGYGVFTRWMRDAGYDFWHNDKHCKNLFANGFDADVSGATRYELVTAFEVFEHLPHPVSTLTQIFELTDSIFFSTDLVPNPVPRLEDWWYFGPEHGQHVSFYTLVGLRKVAARFGCQFYTDGHSFHLMTRKQISERRFRLALHYRVRGAINFLLRRSSLLPEDFRRAMERAKSDAAKLHGGGGSCQA